MTQSQPTPNPTRWPLTRVLIWVLAGAFLGLLADIRVEHVEVVHERGVAWTPIVYSGVMAIFCVISGIFWNRRTQLMMRVLFLAGFIVGGLGFYFHNHGDFQFVFTSEVHAWTDPEMEHPEGPPETAPLSFAGLGLLGSLLTLKRFN